MADISMCQGQGCPSRGHCYRATATPNPSAQSWCHFEDALPEGGARCPDFWPLEGRKQSRAAERRAAALRKALRDE